MPSVYADACSRWERITSAPSATQTFSRRFLAVRSELFVSQPMSVPHVELSSALPLNSSAKTGVQPAAPQSDAPLGSGGAGDA
jgi:hypothetical protein